MNDREYELIIEGIKRTRPDNLGIGAGEGLLDAMHHWEAEVLESFMEALETAYPSYTDGKFIEDVYEGYLED